jgi:ABC-type multidrug transport system fused ATPase/permease subunit
MVPALWVLNRHFRQKLSHAHRAVQESFSRVTSTLAESVNGIRVTQGFVRQELNANLFRDLVADHSRYNMGVARTSGVFLPLLEMHGQLFVALLLVVAGWQALQGTMPLGDIIILGFLANLFLSPISLLGQQYNQALTAMAGAERVFQLLDTPPDWQDAPDAVALPRIEGRIAFRDVTFSYQPDRPALSGISFEVDPGQSVALVGHTGSGKSSIINLLAKFYLPTHGEVLVDGRDLAAVTGQSLHSQMGIVSQNNYLFSGTVMDNIRFGCPSATDAEVIEVVRELGFLDLMGSLPGGLSTRVGERGSGISLGQRQLICFARAMLSDPRILVLDEATSAVDTLTEMRIQEALARLTAGRTSFMIAHRLSTIRNADVVLVLDQGRIIERGTHAQLIAAGGQYARMHAQFAANSMAS